MIRPIDNENNCCLLSLSGQTSLFQESNEKFSSTLDNFGVHAQYIKLKCTFIFKFK